MKKQTKFKIRVNGLAYKRGKNDYSGMSGDIEFENGMFRIQFDGVANNERLANFNLNRCTIYLK